jgi:hypothetical protein
LALGLFAVVVIDDDLQAGQADGMFVSEDRSAPLLPESKDLTTPSRNVLW